MGIEDELLRLFEKASKAADASFSDDSGGADESRCLEAMKLMHSFPVTTSVLVTTQVGKRLRRLTKHPRPKIQKAATDLLDTWKKIVAAEARNGTVDPSQSEGGLRKSSPSVKMHRNLDKEVEVSVETKVKVETVASNSTMSKGKLETETSRSSSSTASSDTKEVKPLNLALIPKTKDAARDKIREMLAEAFAKVVTEAEGHDLVRARAADPIAAAVSVETVMFQVLGLPKGVNKMKHRSIMFNVRDANNPDLRRRLLLGDVTPGDLVNMSAEDMASDQRKMQNEEIKKKALFECERGNARQASTDQFKCGKCGQRKCTYYQMQTRSADEPMTTFVTCVNCNNRWKFC